MHNGLLYLVSIRLKRLACYQPKPPSGGHGKLKPVETDEAVNSDKGIIGFYFDALGFPQSIHRNSTFGSYIVGTKNTEQANQMDH